MTFAAHSRLTTMAHRRFMGDVQALPAAIANKVANVVGQIREQGLYYPGLETRKIAGNQDGRFRLIDVDYSYRIVAAVEGTYVFLERVGPHDPTERWGATATLNEYAERVRVSSDTFRRRSSSAKPETEVLFEDVLSLAQIAGSDAVSEILTDCLPGVLEGWSDGTLEDWMIFLSPVQRRAVDRAVTGPSRVTGGPGTGKTVVGLHRARQFAREASDDRPILVTSFVNTIPKVLEGLFERLAPDSSHRAEFHTVHKLARDELGELARRIDEPSAKRRFTDRLNADRDRYQQLRQGARFSDDYLWEEVSRVIIGRGVDSRDAYLALQRHGRRRPMPAAIRSLVWDIY